jgi:hypothetical protein
MEACYNSEGQWRLRCWLGFHRWTRWEQYDFEEQFMPGRIAPKAQQGLVLTRIVRRQWRHCVLCNTEQDRAVGDDY